MEHKRTGTMKPITSEDAAAHANTQHTPGALPFRMTNDYLFRAVFQSSPKALEGLCRAILRLAPTDTLAVTVLNPIKLGAALDDKEFILDLNILVNGSFLLNLEMQVLNGGDWPERSLSYLCRSFDSLGRGAAYTDVLPITHVGFLDFTLFPECPEFFATYQMMNTENHHVYSDKLRLCVVDLSQIALATDQDKAYGLDSWAALFRATTWEEINMLASKNEYIQEASNTIQKMTAEKEMQLRLQAREDYLYWERIRNNRMAEKEAEIQSLKEENTRLLAELETLKRQDK